MSESQLRVDTLQLIFVPAKKAREMLGEMSNEKFYQHVKGKRIAIVKDGRKSLVPVTSLLAFAASLQEGV